MNHNLIRELREKLGWTLEQARVAAGLKSKQAWHNIESGKQSPRLDTLERIAKALGVPTAKLLK